MKAHFPFFYHSEFLLSIPVVVHILIPYRLLILHSQSLSHSFIYYIPRQNPLPVNGHSSFCMLPTYSGMIRHPSHILLRPMSKTCFVWALSCRASSLSYLSLNCSYSDFLIDDFSGRSEYNYFFRRKVSASRILQVPGALFPEFFQKLFAVCTSQ